MLGTRQALKGTTDEPNISGQSTMNDHLTARGRVRRIAEEYGRTDLTTTDHDIILWEHTAYPVAKWHVVESQIHTFFRTPTP